MAGKCYEKIQGGCPSCGGSPQVFEQEDGTYDSTCFKCGRYDDDPYGEGKAERGPPPSKKSPEEIQAQLDEVIDEMPIRDIPDRGLRAAVLGYMGIRVALSQTDGKTIQYHYYPTETEGVLTGYEVRRCDPKGFYALGKRSGCDPFNWRNAMAANAAGSRDLIIVEDALSCASVVQAFRTAQKGTQYEKNIPSVIALPMGAQSGAKSLSSKRKELALYDNIILCLDNDPAGKDGTEKLVKLLGQDRCKVALLPRKDPNDMTMAGEEHALFNLLKWKAQAIRNDGVHDAGDYFDDASKVAEWGLSWPWPTATKSTFGIRVGEIHIVGAAPKIGKTDHHYQVAEWLVKEHDKTIGLFTFEFTGGKALKMIAGKSAKKPFHRPDCRYTPEELRDAMQPYQGRVKIYDSRQDRDWECVKGAITAMSVHDGVEYFFIDPLTALVSSVSASEANDKLNYIMTDLAKLCQTLPATFFVYTHVNPVGKGTPHEQGGRVLAGQFTGSRAMEKWAHYGWGISRNRLAEDDVERNTSTFEILFDREFGNTARFPVIYNPDTATYAEPIQITSGDY
jgi:hypothetical protein